MTSATQNTIAEDLPLSGVTVVDFSRFLPGQLCTSFLADFGARVVRIENLRDIPKVEATINDESTADARRAHAITSDIFSRAKQSVALDIGHADAASIVRLLVKRAHVVVEDFRPGVLDKLGLGYKVMSRWNRQLNYCSLTFAGQNGPYRNRPGHDQLGLALTGLLHRVGDDANHPNLPNLPIADVTCGLHAVIGILLAQMTTSRTSGGQYIDTSITESLMPFVGWLVSRLSSGARIASRGAPRIDIGIWRASDGRDLCLTNMEPRFWKRFCDAIGRPDYVPRQNDVNSYQEMRDVISKIIATRSCSEWMSIFGDSDIQAAPVNEINEAIQDPHFRARGLIKEIDVSHTKVTVVAPGLHLSKTHPKIDRMGELAGASTRAVLKEIGLSAARIDALQASGCIERETP